ncbi:MAG: NrfD/PsrC family molybdoenzyme membrane anchor subunit [Candidatus Promineifilaceae bacterium]
MISIRSQRQKLLFPGWVVSLCVLMLAGLIAGVIVLVRGLVVTNLTDLVPWGLWIALDLSSIALSAGAFTLSAAVYLLGLKHLQPVARTAVFIGLIGYSMAMMMLLMDIGRPDRLWHALIYWNTHSPLWEVTMCICLYFAVLVLEVMPIFGDADWMKVRWPRLSMRMTKVHHIAPILAIAGLTLSMLHQSSLGATYGILKARPIWYRPGMAVLFIVSAMVAGPALVVLTSRLASKITPKAAVRDELLDQVAKFVGFALIGYLYLRFWDAFSMSYTYEPARSEGLNMLTQGPLSFNFWVGEIILGMVIPMIILLSSRLRSNKGLQMLALLMVVGGLLAYRWDILMVGQLVVYGVLPQDIVPRYTQYFPSLIEILVTIGVVAYGILAFTLGVRYLKVVDHGRDDVSEPSGEATSIPAGVSTD